MVNKMTYFESAEGEIINRKRAVSEFERHGIDEACRKEFFSQFPDKHDCFDAQEVLLFIGY